MTQVTIVTGSASIGKTEHLLERYRRALDTARQQRRPGTTLWITPNRRVQQAISRSLIGRVGTACFLPNILTFDLFAERILKAADQPATPISPVVKRLLLRRIAAQLFHQNELQHFQPIASTTGFLDVVSSFISELKREEVWPETFIDVCQQRTSTFARRDLELGLIYARYQQELADHQWYDNEGRFWLARSAIAAGKVGQFQGVTTLIVDGFIDFTQTQYEILGHLAGRIHNCWISLPIEHPLNRTELFSKSQTAINRIRKHLPSHCSLHIEPLTRRTASHLATAAEGGFRPPIESMRVIADRLFSNPRQIQPSNDGRNLEIIAAKGSRSEWEAVAFRIKQLLANGQTTRPGDIIIGLRAITDDGPRLSEFLSAAGLPVWCEAELPITSSAIVKHVATLLQLELEDWPFDRLIGFLDSTFFRPRWPELQSGKATRAIASILRRLKLHAGRELMLRAVERYADERDSDDNERRESLRTAARLALPLLQRLSRSFDRLRRSHSLNDWADVIATFAEEFGWASNASGMNSEFADDEVRELDLLQRILRTAAEADQKLAGNRRPPRLTLAEFSTELRDLLSHETLAGLPEPSGTIRILSVEQIRNLDVEHLFLLGLTENNFPMNRTDDCLFSESEREDFFRHDIVLRRRSSQHADEMSLFYSVVTRARRSLTLSFPAVNSKGQPVFRSPYLSALKSLFADDAIKDSSEGRLDPLPSLDRALSPSDLRLVAMEEARHGRAGLYQSLVQYGPTRRAGLNSLAACEVADYRFHQHGFTVYEGQLQLARHLSGLQQRFGPRHQFSATELESYAKCPFQFWLSSVLKIGPVESPEEGTDYAGRGTLLHAILAQLLQEDRLREPTSTVERFRELIQEQLGRRVSNTELQRALVETERLILDRWVDAFSSQQVDYLEKIGGELEGFLSLEPEIPFGNLPDAPAAARDSHPPIQFGAGDNVVNLRGRIDRVDVGTHQGKPAYVVVDYKTGQRPSSNDKDLISGRSIQLALYLIAIKRLQLVSPSAVPFQMGFWALQDTGFKPGTGRANLKQISPEKLDWLEKVLDLRLPEFANEIRSGRFVAENADQNCTGRCPYHTVCRVNQIRPLATTLGKQSAPRLDPAIGAASTTEPPSTLDGSYE